MNEIQTRKSPVREMLGCALPIFWAGVICFSYPGIMTTYWQQRFNVGPTETGMVLSFMLVALAVSMFFSGKIHLRFGMQKCLFIGGALYVLSFLILMMAKSIFLVYVWAFIANLGCSFTYGPGMATGQQAMPNRRGLASGILNLVFGLSAAFMSPVLEWMLGNLGYERTNLIITVCIGTFYLAGALCMGREGGRMKGGGRNVVPAAGDFTVKQALKTGDFWIIWTMWAFAGAAGISMVSLAKDYSLAIGIAGVSILAGYNLANGVGRIIMGILTDKIGGEVTLVGAFSIMAAGYLLLPHVGSALPVTICASCAGIGLGGLFTVSSPLVSKRFGLTYFGMIFGIVYTAYGLVGGIVGPAGAGWVLEKTGGSFLVVFTYLGIYSAIGAALMVVLKKRNKENVK